MNDDDDVILYDLLSERHLTAGHAVITTHTAAHAHAPEACRVHDDDGVSRRTGCLERLGEAVLGTRRTCEWRSQVTVSSKS